MRVPVPGARYQAIPADMCHWHKLPSGRHEARITRHAGVPGSGAWRPRSCPASIAETGALLGASSGARSGPRVDGSGNGSLAAVGSATGSKGPLRLGFNASFEMPAPSGLTSQSRADVLSFCSGRRSATPRLTEEVGPGVAGSMMAGLVGRLERSPQTTSNRGRPPALGRSAERRCSPWDAGSRLRRGRAAGRRRAPDQARGARAGAYRCEGAGPA
jgi:hypothetical protein